VLDARAPSDSALALRARCAQNYAGFFGAAGRWEPAGIRPEQIVEPLPPLLLDVIARCEARRIFGESTRPDTAIINYYAEGDVRCRGGRAAHMARLGPLHWPRFFIKVTSQLLCACVCRMPFGTRAVYSTAHRLTRLCSPLRDALSAIRATVVIGSAARTLRRSTPVPARALALRP
jgi:hypothetical protein